MYDLWSYSKTLPRELVPKTDLGLSQTFRYSTYVQHCAILRGHLTSTADRAFIWCTSYCLHSTYNFAISSKLRDPETAGPGAAAPIAPRTGCGYLTMKFFRLCNWLVYRMCFWWFSAYAVYKMWPKNSPERLAQRRPASNCNAFAIATLSSWPPPKRRGI